MGGAVPDSSKASNRHWVLSASLGYCQSHHVATCSPPPPGPHCLWKMSISSLSSTRNLTDSTSPTGRHTGLCAIPRHGPVSWPLMEGRSFLLARELVLHMTQVSAQTSPSQTPLSLFPYPPVFFFIALAIILTIHTWCLSASYYVCPSLECKDHKDQDQVWPLPTLVFPVLG